MTISALRPAALAIVAALALAAPSAVAATFDQPHEQDAYPGLASQAREAVGHAPYVVHAPYEDGTFPGLADKAREAAGPAVSEVRAIPRLAGQVNANVHPADAGQPAARSGGDGFDWGSATIGAGMAIGLALIAFAGAVAVVRTRTPSPTT
jgi:hypothetical protein